MALKKRKITPKVVLEKEEEAIVTTPGLEILAGYDPSIPAKKQRHLS